MHIAKEALDVHLHSERAAHRFANDRRGFTALIKWLGGRMIARIVFEPTDAYYRAFEARFGAMVEQRAPAASSQTFTDMKDLLVARRALIKDRTAAQNRAHQRSLALLKAQAAERLKQIERQLKAIDASLRERLECEPALKARFDILVSIPGLGETTALAMLIDMPERGAIENKCAASLAGLAPMARDSGRWKAKRFLRGGCGELRQALFMLALVTIRSNDDFKVKYQALTGPGKAPKVAIVAVMRKRVFLANALRRDACHYKPKLA